MHEIRIGGRRFRLPANRAVRIGIGIALIVGGLVGFLPILGFWMIPLGLVVLSADFPVVRRWRRRSTVRLMRWWISLRRLPLMRRIFGDRG